MLLIASLLVQDNHQLVFLINQDVSSSLTIDCEGKSGGRISTCYSARTWKYCFAHDSCEACSYWFNRFRLSSQLHPSHSVILKQVGAATWTRAGEYRWWSSSCYCSFLWAQEEKKQLWHHLRRRGRMITMHACKNTQHLKETWFWEVLLCWATMMMTNRMTRLHWWKETTRKNFQWPITLY